MPNYIEQEILDKLERLKNSRQRPDYMQPKEYQQFLPATLGEQKKDESQWYQHLDSIRNNSENATELGAVYAENARNKMLMQQAAEDAKRHKREWKQAQAHQPTFTGGNINVPKGPSGYSADVGFKVGVGDYLTTVNVHGLSFTVNKYAAPRFVGFINALWKAGYHPVSVGGYANRNQANGSGLKSLHAYGLAIDIDPGKNPYYQNPQGGKYALPPNVGALAAKYGLNWGGSWNKTKDYMHFSIPYGGRQ